MSGSKRWSQSRPQQSPSVGKSSPSTNGIKFSSTKKTQCLVCPINGSPKERLMKTIDTAGEMQPVARCPKIPTARKTRVTDHSSCLHPIQPRTMTSHLSCLPTQKLLHPTWHHLLHTSPVKLQGSKLQGRLPVPQQSQPQIVPMTCRNPNTGTISGHATRLFPFLIHQLARQFHSPLATQATLPLPSLLPSFYYQQATSQDSYPSTSSTLVL